MKIDSSLSMKRQNSYSLQMKDKDTQVTSMQIAIDGIKVGASVDIKYVGMWLDNSLTTKKTGCSSVQEGFQKYSINQKEQKISLSMESCKNLTSGLVMALLDYGNALNYGLPNKEVTKLQRLQNYTAKTILGRNK